MLELIDDFPFAMDAFDKGEFFDTAPFSYGNVPQLLVLRQNSLTIEKVSVGGIQKTIHVVVKNQPFLLQAGYTENAFNQVDLSKATVEAHLLYDNELMKEVSFVKMKPLEYKTHVNQSGSQVTVEVRLKVLSSQLEDMNFRIKIDVLDPVTKHPIDGIYAISDPIKVVSKPEQAKKKKQAPSAKILLSKPAKRNLNEELADSLNRINEKCAQQQAMLSKLMALRAQQPVQAASAQNEQVYIEKVPIAPKKEKVEEENSKKRPRSKQEVFVDAFQTFMAVFETLKPEERPEKIRKILRVAGNSNTETLVELLELASSPEPKEEASDKSVVPSCCNQCAHKKEVEGIENFFDDFLSTPV